MRWLILLVFVAGAACLRVTPIEKVINLIEGMKKDIEDEGKAEADTYNSFACFCKDTTKAKSTSVNNGNDKIDQLSADIAEKTASKDEEGTQLSGRKKKQESLAADLQKTEVRCAKQKAEYQAQAADMNKAISSLKKAKQAMKDSKPSAAFLQSSVHSDLMETLAMADAMNLVSAPKRDAISSMLQGKGKGKAAVDPSDPEYKYHSNDIIGVLEQLHSDFTSEKKDLDTEYAKTKKACDEMKASLKEEMSANSDAMQGLEKHIAVLSKEIAGHRSELIEAEADMKDDEEYLKDLTARCEARAKDWDQRSAMRNDELTALSSALKILKGDVKGRADEVNARALLQKVKSSKTEQKPIKHMSLLQGFLSAKAEDRKEKVLALLTSEGDRLKSPVLTALAQRAAADPFGKVKGLIQKLIERLLAESAAEATKKGFCDTQLAKARKDRAFRRADTNDLSADVQGLEAKRDALTEEIKQLASDIEAETQALKENTEDRKNDKAENLQTLKTAKEGLDSVNEALLILKAFYKQAAKAALIQASPVDEDTAGAGFAGSYQGRQSGSKAVLSLLETIASDFDRTVRSTEAAEESAARDFVKFQQHTEASIASKTTKQELDRQDLQTTKNNIQSKMEELRTTQGLLDDALKAIEDLKPTCIDTGMSYQERVEKREQEIAALEKALEILK